jgi:hypothetical protein
VAIPAIDAVIAHVVEMAELDWLFDEFLGAGHIRRSTDDDEKADESARQKERADNTDPRESVGAATKDLRHRMLTVVRPRGGALTSIARQERHESARHTRGNDPTCTTL